NNLRNVLRESVARLGLLSPDASIRGRAADALLDGITPEAANLLRAAYAKETVPRIRHMMALSIAAAEIADPDKARRVAAVSAPAGSSDLRVRSLLQGQLSREADAAVRAAIRTAFDKIQTKLTLFGYLENLVQGISLGSVLLLAVVG